VLYLAEQTGKICCFKINAVSIKYLKLKNDINTWHTSMRTGLLVNFAVLDPFGQSAKLFVQG